MNATPTGDGRVTLALAADELRLLERAMGEVCDGPYAREIGVAWRWDGDPVREAYALYAALTNALAEIERAGGDRDAPV